MSNPRALRGLIKVGTVDEYGDAVVRVKELFWGNLAHV